MFDLNKLAIDTEKEVSGVWHDIDDGMKLKIGRYNSPAYVKAYQRIIGPHRKAIQADTLSDAKKAELAAGALAETVLLDWEGLYDNGALLQYSKAEAKRILSDPRYSTFFGWVMELAQAEKFYREQEIETELGES